MTRPIPPRWYQFAWPWRLVDGRWQRLSVDALGHTYLVLGPRVDAHPATRIVMANTATPTSTTAVTVTWQMDVAS